MKDCLGHELEIGDDVVIVEPYRHDMIPAKIIRFGKVKATVEYHDNRYSRGRLSETSRWPCQIVKKIEPCNQCGKIKCDHG